jgi:uncharacterized protein (DUF1684 family)
MCNKWTESEIATLEEMAETQNNSQFAVRNSQLRKSDKFSFEGLSMLPEFKELV